MLSLVQRYYRPVDRHVVHGELLDFRALCAEAVPPTTRFIVLDLDRTLHMARNISEYMGWELSAYHSYGPDHLERVEDSRDTSRWLLDWRHPVASSKYFLRGVRAWAYPGLYYLLWGRIAGGVDVGKRWRHRLFGAEPFTSIQAMPTIALLHELGGVSVNTAAHLADRILTRFAGDQVFDRDDIAWLRARCPGVRIILSSASPRPTVEAAARALGVDSWECAEIELHDGHFSSPFQLSPMFLHADTPHRISPPSRYRVNAGRAKVDRLLRKYPGLADPDNEVVGISDTWHGEDHCWADHFTRVVDVNSTSPFPPHVVADSPLREVHSAQLLTRAERDHRSAGQGDYVDERRATYFDAPLAGDYDAGQLSAALGDVASVVESCARDHHEQVARCAGQRASAIADVGVALDKIETVVTDYNAAGPRVRRRTLPEINRLVRQYERAMRRRARVQRAASDAALALSHSLAAGREALGSLAVRG
jgi:hypothetical protein